MKFIALLIFCIIHVDGLLNFVNPNDKYFEAIIDRAEVIMETPNITEFRLNVKRVNKTRALTGYFNMKQPIGNNIKMEIKMLKKQEGEYRYLPYTVAPSPFCDFCSKDVYFYPEVARQSDLPEDIANNYPLPIGNYSLYGITFDGKKFPRMILQSGDYCFDIFFYKDNQVYKNFRLYFIINYV